MRITMMAVGSTGDVYPYTILGGELRRRGHDVTIAAFSHFEKAVKDAGLRFFPLPGDASRFVDSLMQPELNVFNYLPNLEKEILPYAGPLLDAMTASCADAEGLVSTFFGSVPLTVAEKYGIPFVQTHYYPMDANSETPIPVTPQLPVGGKAGYNQLTYHVAYLLLGLVERRLLNGWRSEQGVSHRSLRPEAYFTLNGAPVPELYAISPLVFPRPECWESNITMTGFWREPPRDDRTLPESLRAFLDAGDPPVYIGFGSMGSGDMGKTLRTVLDALSRTHLRAILARGWSGADAGKMPHNVYYAEDFLSHNTLFPRCCAVVHHGGAGTTAAGLYAGCPTLVIPFGGDQPFWGGRIAALGLGPKPLRRNALSAERLTHALAELTGTPEYRSNAAALAAGLRNEHGVQTAADRIEAAFLKK